MYVCMYVCMYVGPMYVCMYVCMYLCVCILTGTYSYLFHLYSTVLAHIFVELTIYFR